MTQDEIIRMAREACSPHQVLNTDLVFLERFATLVAAHEKKFWMEQIEVECNEAVLAEREACAKVCESMYNSPTFSDEYIECADAIRSRSSEH